MIVDIKSLFVSPGLIEDKPHRNEDIKAPND